MGYSHLGPGEQAFDQLGLPDPFDHSALQEYLAKVPPEVARAGILQELRILNPTNRVDFCRAAKSYVERIADAEEEDLAEEFDVEEGEAKEELSALSSLKTTINTLYDLPTVPEAPDIPHWGTNYDLHTIVDGTLMVVLGAAAAIGGGELADKYLQNPVVNHLATGISALVGVGVGHISSGWIGDRIYDRAVAQRDSEKSALETQVIDQVRRYLAQHPA